MLKSCGLGLVGWHLTPGDFGLGLGLGLVNLP